MKRSPKVKMVMTLILALAFWSIAANGQDIVNYQGRLTDSEGDAVPDDTYQIIFSIYDDSTDGTHLWSENHTSVQTSNGYFSVQLGSVDNALYLADMGAGPLYLEIQIGTESPLSPRIQITPVPQSAIAQRISGDLLTLPGFLQLNNDDGDSAIIMGAGSNSNNMTIYFTQPLDMPLPAVDFYADSAIGIMMLQNRAQNKYAGIAMTTTIEGEEALVYVQDDSQSGNSAGVKVSAGVDGANVRFVICDTQQPVISMHADTAEASFQMSKFTGQRQGHPLLELLADSAGGSFKLLNPQALYAGERVFEVNSNPAGEFSMYMFQPQPEPPGRVLMEIGTQIGNAASITMFQPQPEPPGEPFMEMLTDQYGANFNMYGPMAGGGRQASLFAEMTTNDVGGGLNLYNDIVKYMGTQPSPVAPGGSLELYNTEGSAMVTLNTDGEVIGRRGSFGLSNSGTGMIGFIAGAGNSSSADYSQLFGIGSSITEDSTFMVDMPHIRFGDETDGYKFPTSDGRPNQVLATNGSGQLGWLDITLAADHDRGALMDIIEQQNLRIEQLENRIAELEKID